VSFDGKKLVKPVRRSTLSTQLQSPLPSRVALSLFIESFSHNIYINFFFKVLSKSFWVRDPDLLAVVQLVRSQTHDERTKCHMTIMCLKARTGHKSCGDRAPLGVEKITSHKVISVSSVVASAPHCLGFFCRSKFVISRRRFVAAMQKPMDLELKMNLRHPSEFVLG
jgi:hypothetical protein